MNMIQRLFICLLLFYTFESLKSQCILLNLSPTDTNVCSTSNSVNMRLDAFTGSVLQWEISYTNLPGSWAASGLANNTTNTITNVSMSVYYRVLYQITTCATKYSTVTHIIVDAATVSGKVINDSNVCKSSNKGELSLTGNVGNVMKWQYTLDSLNGWTDIISNSKKFTFTNLDTTTYFRAIVKSGTCDSIASEAAIITVNPVPQPSFTTNITCDGQPTVFKNTSTISSGFITHHWALGDGSVSTQKHPIKQYFNPDNYLITLTTTSDKGCVATLNKEIEVYTNPIANFTFTNECLGYPISFINKSSTMGIEGVDAYWTFGDNTKSVEQSPIHNYAEAGIYTVKLLASTTQSRCVDSLERQVSVYALPVAFAGRDTTISKGIPLQMIGTGGANYNWSPAENLSNAGSSQPIFNATTTTDFVLRVTDINNCVAYDSITVNIKDDFILEATNIITPDGNGQNDTWVINNINNYPNCNVKVFNRWGLIVFASKGYKNDWNGSNGNGDILPDGTYYYSIEDNNQIIYKGAITLLRNK